jgi:hypothetical protein
MHPFTGCRQLYRRNDLVRDSTGSFASAGGKSVFHFLTAASDRVACVGQVTRALKAGGHAIDSIFGPEGPRSAAAWMLSGMTPSRCSVIPGNIFVCWAVSPNFTGRRLGQSGNSPIATSKLNRGAVQVEFWPRVRPCVWKLLHGKLLPQSPGASLTFFQRLPVQLEPDLLGLTNCCSHPILTPGGLCRGALVSLSRTVQLFLTSAARSADR